MAKGGRYILVSSSSQLAFVQKGFAEQAVQVVHVILSSPG